MLHTLSATQYYVLQLYRFATYVAFNVIDDAAMLAFVLSRQLRKPSDLVLVHPPKPTTLKIHKSLLDLFHRIHHKRAMPHDGLIERLTTE